MTLIEAMGTGLPIVQAMLAEFLICSWITKGCATDCPQRGGILVALESVYSDERRERLGRNALG